MKSRMMSLVLAGGLIALTAWAVRNPSPAQVVQPGLEDPKTAPVSKLPIEVVERGLAFLIKNQADDGHWEGDDGQFPVATTGLAGLALSMAIHVPKNGPVHAPRGTENNDLVILRKAEDWLMKHCRRDGLIFSGHPSEQSRYMEGHGLAMIFLASVCQAETDKDRKEKIAAVLARAVKYTAKAQSIHGGWHHTSRMEGHDFHSLLPTVIQIQALQAVENAGIPLPADVRGDGEQYIHDWLKNQAARAKADGRWDDIAAALACHAHPKLWAAPNPPPLHTEWLKTCVGEIQPARVFTAGRDGRLHYYYAQALHEGMAGQIASEDWTEYQKAMFDRLKRAQDDDGGWPAGSGVSVGRVYSAAVWCTVLQLQKNDHPSKRRMRVFTT